jgi:hypothetical protein
MCCCAAAGPEEDWEALNLCRVVLLQHILTAQMYNIAYALLCGCCCAAGPEEDWEATPADFRGVVTHIKEK